MAEYTFTSPLQSSKSSKQRLLWIAFIILLFLIAGVWWYQRRETVTLPSVQELGAIDQRFKELIDLVETIQHITLDTSILQDARFSSLERIPFSASSTPEESGRVNPFAPFPK
mgnify:FL=1